MDKYQAAILGILLIILVGGGTYYYFVMRPSVLTEGQEISAEEVACTNSGGTVATSTCCKSSGNFPNPCLIGACGCSLENSHEVKICDCGDGKCFDGEKCLAVQ